MKTLAAPALEMPRSAIRMIVDLATAMPDALRLELGQPDTPIASAYWRVESSW